MSLKPCKDHLGQEFPSVSAMAKHWNIRPKRLIGRLGKDWNLEKALTTPVPQPKKGFVDHLGVRYETLAAMARAWKINFFTLRARYIKKKWSIEKALTHPLCNSGKKAAAYAKQKAAQTAAEKAAQKAERRKKYLESFICKDHLGVEHANIKTMCAAWGVRVSTFMARRAAGYPLEVCLDKNARLYQQANARNNRKACADHLGVTYPSLKEMCAAWGVDVTTYTTRRKQDMSPEDALICPRSGCPTFVMSGTKKYFFVNRKKFDTPDEAADYFDLNLLPEDFDGMTDDEICGMFANAIRPAKAAELVGRFASDPAAQKNIGLLKSWGIDPDTAKTLAEVLRIPPAKSGKKAYDLGAAFKKARICPRIVEPYPTNRMNSGLFSLSECALSPRAFAKVLRERFQC